MRGANEDKHDGGLGKGRDPVASEVPAGASAAASAGTADAQPLTALTPTLLTDEQFEPYSTHFDFVFEDKSITNIGLLGAYASGKSSVMSTHMNRARESNPGRKYVTLSLAHFSGGDALVGESSLEHQLEGYLLNQLTQLVDPKDAPLSKIRTLTHESNTQLFLRAALVVLVLLALAFFVLWLATGDRLYAHLPAVLIVAGLVAFPLIYLLLRYQPLRGVVRKLKIGGGEIELFGKDDSLLDRYLSDVIYLLDASKADVVVFEDMDRFPSTCVFERLRGINEMLNDANRIGKPDRKEPVRFFYLVRDDLFSEGDRRKFFDYIIPVAPYVDASNSFGLLKSKLNAAGITPDETYLMQLAVFVSDSRAVLDIANEAVCYRDTCFGKGAELTAADANRLVALMAYKVRFPADFARLQVGDGYLHKLVANAAAAKSEAWRVVGERLDGLEQLDTSDIVPEERDELGAKRASLETDRALIYGPNLDVALKYCGCEGEGFYNVRDSVRGGLDPDGVYGSPHFSLVRFLVSNGYVDASYSRYISRFEGSPLTAGDQAFFTNVVQGLGNPPDYALDDPAKVLTMLSEHQFGLKGLRNYSAVREMLENQPAVSRIAFERIAADWDYDFVFWYVLSDMYTPEVFEVLQDTYPSVYLHTVKAGYPQYELRRYLQLVLSDARNLVPLADRAAIVVAAQEDPLFLQLGQGVDGRRLCAGLEVFGFVLRLCDSRRVDESALSYVLEKLMFERSADMFGLLIRIVFGVSSDRLEKEGLIPLLYDVVAGDSGDGGGRYRAAVEAALPSLLQELLDTGTKIGSRDQDVVVWVLEHEGVDEQLAHDYIEAMDCAWEVTALGDVSNKAYWPALIDGSRVVPTLENVVRYYAEFGLDERLSSFINGNCTLIDFGYGNIEEACSAIGEAGRQDAFVLDLVGSHAFGRSEYRGIVEGLEVGYADLGIDGLEEWQVIDLVECGALFVSQTNIGRVRREFGDGSEPERCMILADAKAYAESVDPVPTAGGTTSARVVGRTASGRSSLPANADLIVDALGNGGLDVFSQLPLLDKLGEVALDEAYDAQVNAEILRRHFLEDDIVKLNNVFAHAGSEGLAEAVVERCVASVDALVDAEIPLDFGLLHDVLAYGGSSGEAASGAASVAPGREDGALGASTASAAGDNGRHGLDLVSSNGLDDALKGRLIVLADKASAFRRVEFAELFKAAGFSSLRLSITSSTYGYIEAGDWSRDLLDLLRHRFYISSYSLTGDGRYKVNPKRSFPSE